MELSPTGKESGQRGVADRQIQDTIAAMKWRPTGRRDRRDRHRYRRTTWEGTFYTTVEKVRNGKTVLFTNTGRGHPDRKVGKFGTYDEAVEAAAELELRT